MDFFASFGQSASDQKDETKGFRQSLQYFLSKQAFPRGDPWRVRRMAVRARALRCYLVLESVLNSVTETKIFDNILFSNWNIGWFPPRRRLAASWRGANFPRAFSAGPS